MRGFIPVQYLFCAIVLVSIVKEGTAISCTANDACLVNCTGLGLGPEAPDLYQIVPSKCHRKFKLLLNSNNIQSIPSNWLSGWNILSLDLSWNPLWDIAEGAFDGSGCSLKRLSLYHCTQLVSMRRLSKGTFQGLGCSLVELNLNDTLIMDADLDALADLKLLEELHLNRNALTTIGEGVLNHMKSLTRLFLNGNTVNIPYSVAPFEGMDRLSLISLQRNRLQNASYCTFGHIPALATLAVDDNPLACNCSNWWLKAAGYLPDGLVADCLANLDDQCSEYVPDCGPVSGKLSALSTSTPVNTTKQSEWATTTPVLATDYGLSRTDVIIIVGVTSPLGTLILVAIAIALWRCWRRHGHREMGSVPQALSTVSGNACGNVTTIPLQGTLSGQVMRMPDLIGDDYLTNPSNVQTPNRVFIMDSGRPEETSTDPSNDYVEPTGSQYEPMRYSPPSANLPNGHPPNGQPEYARVNSIISDIQGETMPPADIQGETTSPADIQGETTSPADIQGETTSQADIQGETTSPADIQGETTSPADIHGETTSPAVADENAEDNVSHISIVAYASYTASNVQGT